MQGALPLGMGLEDLKVDCAAKAKEWTERQHSVSEELGAIAKAKEILSSGVKVFLQVHRRAFDRRRI